MKTVIFDLDGTLAISSKEQIDTEMVALLSKMLVNYNVAIISSQSWKSLNSNVAELFDSSLKQLTGLFSVFSNINTFLVVRAAFFM